MQYESGIRDNSYFHNLLDEICRNKLHNLSYLDVRCIYNFLSVDHAPTKVREICGMLNQWIHIYPSADPHCTVFIVPKHFWTFRRLWQRVKFPRRDFGSWQKKVWTLWQPGCIVVHRKDIPLIFNTSDSSATEPESICIMDHFKNVWQTSRKSNAKLIGKLLKIAQINKKAPRSHAKGLWKVLTRFLCISQRAEAISN